MFTINETLQPTLKSQWRGWLEKFHDKKSEIWLIFYKKSTGKQTLSYQHAVEEALCFGWIDGIEKSLDHERYALRFTPRAKKSPWSSANVKRYHQLVKDNKMTETGTQAFRNKSHVYTPFSNKKSAVEWHLSHKMPKNPTTEERVLWHIEHKKMCGCRPIPKSLHHLIKE